MKTLIFIDLPTSITPANLEVIHRHENYASLWAEVAGRNSRILVISFMKSQKKVIRYSFGNLDLIQIPIVVNKKVLREIKDLQNELRAQEISYVSGDPWLKFLATKIFTLLFRLPGKVQIQIHADVFDRNWYRQTWTSTIKRIFLPISLLSAANIRVVSVDTKKRLTESNLFRKKRIFLAPVPLNIDFSNLHFNASNRPYTVGILGRLQRERGLDLFLDYLRSNSQYLKGIRLLVAGSGPDRETFQNDLEKFLGRENVEFLGDLDRMEVERFWGKIGVLASFAPSESYGRTIRESLCHGVPVLAYPSKGVQNLLKEFPGCALEVSEKQIGVRESKNQIQRLITHVTNKAFLEYSKKEMNRTSAVLINSWEELYQ
jgi:glycosyltransferase involved in cell wall biosynthesis